ncbi:MAG: DegV family protein [Oscillibacter sp.]
MTSRPSMVNPDLMANYFERALSQGDDVLYVGMSGGISGTGAGRGYRRGRADGKIPRAGRSCTIGTYAASLGEGLQVLEAAQHDRRGKEPRWRSKRISLREDRTCARFSRSTTLRT